MRKYLSPGVYIKHLFQRTRPIEPVRTGTAGFLGSTERGPTDPRLLTSYADFERLYGGRVDGSHLQPAVRGFFINGGERCYVGRVTATAATASGALSTGDEPSSGTDEEDSVDEPTENEGDAGLLVRASEPGVWGERVAVVVADASSRRRNDQLFSMIVRYWADESTYGGAAAPSVNTLPAPDIQETYDDLSADSSSNRFYADVVNGASSLVELDAEAAVRPENTDGEPLWLAGPFGSGSPVTVDHYLGEEPTEIEGLSGFKAFERIGEISIICVPDEHDITGLTDTVLQHCHEMGDRFAILQAERSPGPISDIDPPNDDSMAAFYYPWLSVGNPDTGVTEMVPPGGHVAGVYARTDEEYGVHKAPANQVVHGVDGLQRTVTNAEQAVLNPRGVNCIRDFRHRGIRVWGARTASSEPEWRYVNVRRLVLFLKESIQEGIEWARSKSNDEQLWERIVRAIRNFLSDVWKGGAFMGETPEEAFFVMCDRNTMTQSDIDNGRLVCEIGVAPMRPAEFVVFRITQWMDESE